MKAWLICVVLLAIAVVSPGNAQPFARTGVVLVLDFSGSMLGELEGQGGARINRLRSYVQDLADNYSREGFSGPLRVVQFGAKRAGTCADFDVLSRPSGPYGAAANRDLTDFVNKTEPKGRTPLEEATKLAIREADRMIRGNEADAVRLILISDMQDTCDGGEWIEETKVTDEMLCNQGTRVKTTLEQVVADLRQDLDRDLPAEVIKIEYVISVLARGASENLNAFSKCVPTKVIEYPFPPPLPPRVPFPVFAPPSTATITVVPILERPDGLGRAVADPQMTVAVNGSAINAALVVPSEGRSVSDIPLGSELEITLTGSGLTSSAKLRVEKDETVNLPWRLPILTAKPVAPAERDWPDDVVLSVTAPDGQKAGIAFLDETGFDLKPGTYVFTASREGFQDVIVEATVLDADLAVEIPMPTASLVFAVKVDVTVEPPSLALGAGPDVVFRLVPQVGQPLVLDGGDSVDLNVGQSYRYQLVARGVAGEQILSEGDVYDGGSVPPDAVSVHVTPPQVILGSTVDGEWQLSNIEAGINVAMTGAMLVETVAPGSYRIQFNGRNVCPENGLITLAFGDRIRIDQSGESPEECQ